MSNILYHYDPETGLLISTSHAIVDPLEKGEHGEPVFMSIPYTTFVAPAGDVGEGRVQFFDPKSNSWRITIDNRETNVINVKTKEIKKWGKIGPILDPDYTADIPTSDRLPFVTWVNGEWTVTPGQRDFLLDDIWHIRKLIRDAECASDLEYNGHVYHVDAVSFNDIMLAAQEALLTQDFVTTRRWVTADSIDVQLNGADFVAIMQLYGARRQRLVYSSNEAWQHDTTLTTDALFALRNDLRKQMGDVE